MFLQRLRRRALCSVLMAPGVHMQENDKPGHGFAIAVFVMFGVVVFTVLGYFFLLPDVAPKRITVAVMPFTSDSGTQSFLLEGFAEEVSRGVAMSREVTVIDFEASVQFHALGTRSRGFTNELGATHILDGSIERGADAWIIAARLVDISQAANKRVWGETFDAVDLVAARDAMTQQVRSAIYDRGSEATPAGPPVGTDAYALFLQARYAQRYGQLADAERFARQSLDVENNGYAATVLAQLAPPRMPQWEQTRDSLDEFDYLPARILSAQLTFSGTGDIETYHRSLTELAGDFPNSAALSRLSDLYVALGRFDQAQVLLERSVRVLPRSAVPALALASVRSRAGDVPGAREALRIAALREPQSPDVARAQWLLQLADGSADEPEEPGLRPIWLASIGEIERAADLFENLVGSGAQSCDQQVEVALYLDATERALDAVECAEGWWTNPPIWWDSADPRWQRFTSHARYRDYLESIGFDLSSSLPQVSMRQLLAPRRP